MDAGRNLASTSARADSAYSRALRNSFILAAAVVTVSLASALLLPQGILLAAISDGLQVCLVTVATFLSFQNFKRNRSHVRDFWLLIFLGSTIWLASLLLWSFCELLLRRPVPDIPVADMLLFLKLVPLTAALALEPHRSHDKRFRAFGLLDVSILMFYSLFLYAFCVYAYRLLPGATDIYNFQFDLADGIGNEVFTVAAAAALFRARGHWRGLHRIYFFSAACYGLSSDISNVAIDRGSYYSGSLFDVPLTVAVAGFVCFVWIGRSLTLGASSASPPGTYPDEPPAAISPISSHLAMVVTLSTPIIGLWLLNRSGANSPLFPFRLATTLVTIFLLTLLLSIKQDLLTVGLIGSLQRLSANYTSINRLKDHLVQSEKLTALGELVAQVANQIKGSMTSILDLSARIPVTPAEEPRVSAMALKINHYARRTDALVQNMLRFAQETPVELAPVELKQLVESALHLSGVAQLPKVSVDLEEEGNCPPVRGDSSQLLHVFLQIIANAVDALEVVSGGTLDISISTTASGVKILFADSGPGIREPGRVFEPFYTTKPVGKGTGLGLSTCYGIIQQHDGEISCGNLPAGGALFTIILPAAVGVPVASSESTAVFVEDAQ